MDTVRHIVVKTGYYKWYALDPVLKLCLNNKPICLYLILLTKEKKKHNLTWKSPKYFIAMFPALNFLLF